MKLSKIANQEFRNALSKLLKKQVPLRTAFKLKTILRIVNEEHQKYEECRKDAINRFAEKDEFGLAKIDEAGKVKLSEENLKLFTKEFKDLLDMEIEVPQIKASEFGEELRITAEEVVLLEDIILEE